jgi:hypothetical protein
MMTQKLPDGRNFTALRAKLNERGLENEALQLRDPKRNCLELSGGQT